MKLAMVVVVSALANVQTAMSVPVVPNFTQGSMTSTTETTSTGLDDEHDGNDFDCDRDHK